MPTILLARHGQGSFGGADYDVLSSAGREQSALLAADLVRRGVRIDRVVSGTLARQRDTAAPIAEAAGLEVEIDERWNEYETEGILERHSDSAARPDRPPGSDAPQITSREFQDILEVALLAWIDAEDDGSATSWPVFSGGVRDALHEVADGLGSGETALVATSGGVISAICVALLGVPARAFVTFNRVSVNSGVTKLVVGRGGMTLISFNEHGHLERPGGSLVTYR